MHPNAERFTRAVEAFGKGDIETLAKDHFAPDITWHLAGHSPLAGTYKGQGEVFGFFQKAMELTAGTFNVASHAVLGDDEHVVLLARTTGSRPDGRTLDVNEALVIHVVDGKETEVWHSPFERDEWDAFWA